MEQTLKFLQRVFGGSPAALSGISGMGAVFWGEFWETRVRLLAPQTLSGELSEVNFCPVRVKMSLGGLPKLNFQALSPSTNATSKQNASINTKITLNKQRVHLQLTADSSSVLSSENKERGRKVDPRSVPALGSSDMQ